MGAKAGGVRNEHSQRVEGPRGGPPVIAFICASCEKNLSVEDERDGNDVACPGCGKVMQVPSHAAPPAAEQLQTVGRINNPSYDVPLVADPSARQIGNPSYDAPPLIDPSTAPPRAQLDVTPEP